jgi:hypothetical protein
VPPPRVAKWAAPEKVKSSPPGWCEGGVSSALCADQADEMMAGPSRPFATGALRPAVVFVVTSARKTRAAFRPRNAPTWPALDFSVRFVSPHAAPALPYKLPPKGRGLRCNPGPTCASSPTGTRQEASGAIGQGQAGPEASMRLRAHFKSFGWAPIKLETSCHPSALRPLGAAAAMPSRLRWLSSGSPRLLHTCDE